MSWVSVWVCDDERHPHVSSVFRPPVDPHSQKEAKRLPHCFFCPGVVREQEIEIAGSSFRRMTDEERDRFERENPPRRGHAALPFQNHPR